MSVLGEARNFTQRGVIFTPVTLKFFLCVECVKCKGMSTAGSTDDFIGLSLREGRGGFYHGLDTAQREDLFIIYDMLYDCYVLKGL